MKGKGENPWIVGLLEVPPLRGRWELLCLREIPFRDPIARTILGMWRAEGD